MQTREVKVIIGGRTYRALVFDIMPTDFAGVGTYILGPDRQPIPSEPIAAAIWHAENVNGLCFVAETHVGDVIVTTTFVGFDLQQKPESSPMLWESIITGGCYDGRTAGARSFAEAHAAHSLLVRLVSEAPCVGKRQVHGAKP